MSAASRATVSTAVGLYGDPEFVVAFLTVKLGLGEEEAVGTLFAIAEQFHGCDPGMVPEGRQEWAMRLCSDCAATAGVEVGDISAAAGTTGSIPAYAQPEGGS